MKINDIKELISAVEKSSIQKLDLELDGARILMTKYSENVNNESISVVKTENVKKIESKVDIEDIAVGKSENDYFIESPIVGVFYSAPSPESDDFVKIGDSVSNGQIVCILEAMKMMNEIECEEAGEIVEVLVKNGEPVEYGQALFRVRRG
ncbi:MAG: acetyl-CoA carboxylase biotin carboxyl carrier protein [Firmicutes bacterium]|jgi:acetyl-CoA carboxylase biotin carboxyl carrier protein|nr:acetyl-CoA carboxylase biotin carboxyl carrier protein [Bacillota bacterium]